MSGNLLLLKPDDGIFLGRVCTWAKVVHCHGVIGMNCAVGMHSIRVFGSMGFRATIVVIGVFNIIRINWFLLLLFIVSWLGIIWRLVSRGKNLALMGSALLQS